MSIDVRLVPLNETVKITKEFLLERIPSELKIVTSTEDSEGNVRFFQVSPIDLPNPENIEFEFHLQKDGTWLHPVETRSDEGFKLDQEVVALVSNYLRMEQDFTQ